MNAKKSKRGINLFLLELIIVLLFFSISGAVILNMFSVANSKAEKSMLNEKIILCSQSVSETFSAGGSLDSVTDKLFGGVYTSGADGVRTVYVDKSLEAVKDSGDAFLTLKLRETRDEREGGVYSKLYYEFTDGGEVGFSGTSTSYIPDFEVNGNG